MPIDTRKAEHRTLRFTSLDEVLAELDRLEVAERAGTLRCTGNWTAGQAMNHLAAWMDYGYEGYPPQAHPPWLVRVIAKMLKNRILYKPMQRGMKIGRIEGGTLGVELLSTSEGAAKLRSSIARCRREPVRHHSPAFGPMTDDERLNLNLRHVELHLGYLWP